MTPCHLQPRFHRIFHHRVNGHGLTKCQGEYGLFKHGRRVVVACQKHRELVVRGAVRVDA